MLSGQVRLNYLQNLTSQFEPIGFYLNQTVGHEEPETQFNHHEPSTGGIPMDLHHPFVREFPEYSETIRRLRLGDHQFRKMFEEYHQLDDEICRIEEEVESASDQQIDELKFKRAKLKDTLYSSVRKSETALAH
jgi:uncharacterized protein